MNISITEPELGTNKVKITHPKKKKKLRKVYDHKTRLWFSEIDETMMLLCFKIEDVR